VHSEQLVWNPLVEHQPCKPASLLRPLLSLQADHCSWSRGPVSGLQDRSSSHSADSSAPAHALLHPQQAAQCLDMAAYEEALCCLSSQLRFTDQQAEGVVLPLVVADTHPGLFQQHLLPFLDGGSKRALNMSCQLASKHVRPAVSTITFRASNVQLPTTVLAEWDPSSRYPAASTLCLDFTSSTFGSPENLQIVRRVAGFTRLLGQLRHLRVDLSHMHGADQQGWWLELVDSIVTQCVQLQSFTVQSLTGSSAPASVATLCWRAQRQHQQLHQMLSELATVQIPDCAEAMLMARCCQGSLGSCSSSHIPGTCWYHTDRVPPSF
jgi:hypothetical protein